MLSLRSNVLQEILQYESELPLDELEDIYRKLRAAERVYLHAVGRCGLVLRMLAVRLTHLSITCHVVGDTTTPAIKSTDLLLVASGSGSTSMTVSVARQAREVGADVLAFTVYPESPLAEVSDKVIKMPGVTKVDLKESGTQPPGSLFEQLLLCFLDELVVFIFRTEGVSNEALMARHANLE